MTVISSDDHNTIVHGNPYDGDDDPAKVAAYAAAIKRVGPEGVRAIQNGHPVTREDVGAGDFTIGYGVYVGRAYNTVELRWGVYQWTGRGYHLTGSVEKRSDAVRHARKAWKEALAESRR